MIVYGYERENRPEKEERELQIFSSCEKRINTECKLAIVTLTSVVLRLLVEM